MEEILKEFPEFVKLLTFIGALRVVMKPLQPLTKAALEFIKLSPSKKDDQMVESVVKSKFYKLVKFLIDWLLSVKY